jgi:hypothetical protein
VAVATVFHFNATVPADIVLPVVGVVNAVQAGAVVTASCFITMSSIYNAPVVDPVLCNQVPIPYLLSGSITLQG